jgi:hypothetical protein
VTLRVSWAQALTDVDVEGQTAYILAEHEDQLAATKPTKAVHLLGGFDQWVLGPGTEDPHVIPPARRRAVSRQSGWIAPIVVAGGVVAGTWDLKGDAITVSWFAECGRPPSAALGAEKRRLQELTDRELTLSVSPS